ncbi:unnamed protein product [Caenorhabditis sp. 36 PRJEB53466]|nr:unnamed protein product [Caenorhabditis sp. 36 PRJEB53466]
MSRTEIRNPHSLIVEKQLTQKAAEIFKNIRSRSEVLRGKADNLENYCREVTLRTTRSVSKVSRIKNVKTVEQIVVDRKEQPEQPVKDENAQVKEYDELLLENFRKNDFEATNNIRFVNAPFIVESSIEENYNKLWNRGQENDEGTDTNGNNDIQDDVLDSTSTTTRIPFENTAISDPRKDDISADSEHYGNNCKIYCILLGRLGYNRK